MDPSGSRDAFEALLGDSGIGLTDLRPGDALRLMAAFYTRQRADGCRVDQQGDMLLYQWGTYGFDAPETFQLDLTRQFSQEVGEEDPDMSQLSLTMHYAPTSDLRALGSGNRWCEDPTALSDFEAFIHESQPFRTAVRLRPARVSLNWGPV
jgi:hypothetical protein